MSAVHQSLDSPSSVPLRPAAPKALVFDLGGVLIDIDFSRALKAWQPSSALSLDELRSGFRFDDAYARHERDEIGAQEYFSHLATAIQLSGTVVPRGFYVDKYPASGWQVVARGDEDRETVKDFH